ncbi:hypothetical protein KAR91_14870 [Candidatus Pacearchaeota archaeon]|nr:hypothetical protein [Candidatus Pacearchaeota archaeon]
MSCDKTQAEWNPSITQGQTFNDPLQIAINEVIGYDPADTFAGWITAKEEAESVLVDYAMVETDAVNGLLTPTLTAAQTQTLPKGALYHNIEWTRDATGEVIVISGRPQVKANAKKRP